MSHIDDQATDVKIHLYGDSCRSPCFWMHLYAIIGSGVYSFCLEAEIVPKWWLSALVHQLYFYLAILLAHILWTWELQSYLILGFICCFSKFVMKFWKIYGSSLMFRLLWLYLTGENYSKQLLYSPLCWVRKNIYIITHTLDFTADGLFCILNAFLLPSITV